MKTFAVAISTGLVLTSVAPAFAQTSPTREQRDSRYQIGMMEGVLEKAVEHGAALMRDRLRSVLPADMLLAEPARARGIRLEGYGVLFDIDVPALQSAPLWSLQALDQNNVGLGSAINALRNSVKASGDANLEQALQRVELNLPRFPPSSARPRRSVPRPPSRLRSRALRRCRRARCRRPTTPR